MRAPSAPVTSRLTAQTIPNAESGSDASARSYASSIVGATAPREDAAVDARVQRLDAAAEHLGRVRHILDRRHRQAVLLEECRGAAARDEVEAGVGEAAREV